jgi:chromosome partitioning protein
MIKELYKGVRMGIFSSMRSKTTASNNAKVISFLNQKGGVGKTTMAFNTAHALSQTGAKVLCMDMDPQANLGLLFNIENTNRDNPFQIHQLLLNSVRELKALHTPLVFSDVVETVGNIDILPSGQELSGFELSVAGISAPRQTILKKFIEKNGLTKIYDYIIIDGPPTLGLLVVNVLCASDGVLVPFRPDGFSRAGLNHFYEILEQIDDMGVTNTPQILAHIPNLVDSRRKQEGLDLGLIEEDILKHEFKGKLIEPFYNKAQLVKSQAQRKSVFDFQNKEYLPLKKQFSNLASIIQEWEYEQEQ